MPQIEPHAFIERIRRGMQDEPGIRALFLAGSHGSGKADAYSDIDFVALAEEGDHAAVVAAWRPGGNLWRASRRWCSGRSGG